MAYSGIEDMTWGIVGNVKVIEGQYGVFVDASVAHNFKTGGFNNQPKENKTDWTSVNLSGQLGQEAAAMVRDGRLKKGSKLWAKGKKKAKAGNDGKAYITLYANSFIMQDYYFDGRQSQQQGGGYQQGQQQQDGGYRQGFQMQMNQQPPPQQPYQQPPTQQSGHGYQQPPPQQPYQQPPTQQSGHGYQQPPQSDDDVPF